MPKAWNDLLTGLAILSKHHTSAISPLHCEHDKLTVLSDESKFTDEEIEQLDELGFRVDDDGGFYSMRFGSA